MRNCAADTAKILSVALIAVCGCAMPIQVRDNAGLSSVAADTDTDIVAATAGMSPAANEPSVTSDRTTVADAAAGPTEAEPATPTIDGAIAQVGHTTPVDCDAQGYVGDCESCVQGGCESCVQGSCGVPCFDQPAVRPHGYAMQPMTGWNAFGIDPQEFICDGGDHPPAAGPRSGDSIGGLQPEDTVVRYTIDDGNVHVQASNRVCLYAPRFASVRKITGAVAGSRAIGLSQFDRPLGANKIDQQTPNLVFTDTTELRHAEVARRIDAMRDRNRGVPIEGIQQPEMADEVLEAMAGLLVLELSELRDDEKALLEKLALAAVTWDLDESVEAVVEDLRVPTLTRDRQLRGFTIYEFPDAGRLRITKLADRSDALPGELVHFVIRVENVGDSAVGKVVIADNLTTRLEYVDGSTESSIPTDFESTSNEGESLRLQWRLSEPLEVGDSVTIELDCRVR